MAWEILEYKVSRRLRKSPVKTEVTENSRFYCSFVKLERPKTRQFFGLLWRYFVVETELGLLEASEVHGSICIALAALPRLLHHHHHHPTSSDHLRSSSVQVGFALEFALPFLQLALASMSLALSDVMVRREYCKPNQGVIILSVTLTWDWLVAVKEKQK